MSSFTQLPSLGTTFGALFIGLNLSTILYGITWVQTFIYVTSRRRADDPWWIQGGVYLLLYLLDTGHQVLNVMGLYWFLVTNFANPSFLASNDLGSGGVELLVQSLLGVIIIFVCQLYFAWRVWKVGSLAGAPVWKWIMGCLTATLAVVTLGTNLVVVGRSLSSGGAAFFESSATQAVDWKIAFSSSIICDSIIVLAMIFGVQRSRTGFSGTTGSLNRLLLLSVNTALLTTLLTIAALITFVAMPGSLVYGAIELITPRSYLNSALATLNTREYIAGKGHKIHFSPNSSNSGGVEISTFVGNSASMVDIEGQFAPQKETTSIISS